MTAPSSQSTVTPSAGGDSEDRGRRVGRLSPVAVVALLLAAVPLLWHAWVALHGFFTQDDFVFTYHAAHSPLSLHYLFQSYGGGAHSGGPHIMPAQFLLIWLVTRIAPGNYAVAVAPLLVMQALTCWVLWRLLSQLFPGNGARLIPFGFFTLSPVMFITSMWWAFGLQVVPFALALFFALDQHVRYLHTGRRRHALLALVATVSGLVFWEKAALIVPVVFAVTAILAPVNGVWRRVVSAARTHARVWAAYAAAGLSYAVLYFVLAEPAGGEALRRADVGRLAQTMVTHAFIPRLFGGPWHDNFAGSSPTIVVVLSSLAVAAIVVVGVIRGRSRAAVAWLALGAYLAGDIVLLAGARLGFVGPVIGTDPRYIADAIPVAIILGSLALLEPALPKAPAPTPALVATDRSLRISWVVVLPALLLAVGAIVSTALAIPAAQNPDSHSYAATLANQIKAHPKSSLFDGGVPAAAMLPVFGDDWRVSRVIGVTHSRTHIDATSDELFMADADGFMQPFTFFFPTASKPGTVYQCGHLAQPGGTDIPLEQAVKQKHVVVRLDYFTGEANRGTVQAGRVTKPVQFTAGGVHSLYAVTDGPLQAIRVSTGFPVCVTQVLVGGPAPLPK